MTFIGPSDGIWLQAEVACDACVNAEQDHRPLSFDQHGSNTCMQSPSNATKGCVLIVDDDSAVRETLVELLDLAGFKTIEAEDASQAASILRQQPSIAVLITDLSMPGADGITLIRQAREIRPGLPAILLTGYAEQASSVSSDGGGRFHVLRKPVESDHLIEEITLLIDRGIQRRPGLHT